MEQLMTPVRHAYVYIETLLIRQSLPRTHPTPRPEANVIVDVTGARQVLSPLKMDSSQLEI